MKAEQEQCGHRYVARHTTTGHAPNEFPERTWWRCQDCGREFKECPVPIAVSKDVIVERGYSTGWVCPVCGSVYAIWVAKCSRCGPKIATTTTSDWTESA